jgi:protein HOOK3
MAESELDKHTNLVTELTKKIDELQVKADAAARLKDQVDEYVPLHLASSNNRSTLLSDIAMQLTSCKRQRTSWKSTRRNSKKERICDKVSRCVPFPKDLNCNLSHISQALEKQNADLVDKNATLEEEYRKVAAFKPLMESYKNQIAELETRGSQRSQEIDTLKFELEQANTKLRIVDEERTKDRETMELYQERVKELEIGAIGTRPMRQARREADNGAGDIVDGINPSTPTAEGPDGEDEDFEDDGVQGLGGELDDALTGTTMTDLKLQIRKLQRELESVKKNEADASRLLVLENLLEDANRMKTRYENDYLSAHREKLILQRDLEEIRSGKSMGDG